MTYDPRELLDRIEQQEATIQRQRDLLQFCYDRMIGPFSESMLHEVKKQIQEVSTAEYLRVNKMN